ncbi:MAG: pyridoxal-5'-phosphate-dependent protein subunit beta [Deltaproteobacteria bacterium]|nr:pyridoxal-5'-phosphate-dependent protein subunit beta [Deltaproteobacteria bacterium]
MNEPKAADLTVLNRTVERFRSARIALPTFAELRDPNTIPAHVQRALENVEPDAPHPLNLYRVHWYNDSSRKKLAKVPGHLVLDKSLTGVDAKIVVALGERFPMITAHKVLAAFGCLAPRVVNGEFDPTTHKAVWPSTGNYCRGGVAISRIMGCRGVAVLPEGMSEERFDWLDGWVTDKSDIIRTPGTESNVKEIYDACAELSKDSKNFIFNQFSELANYAVHATVTGPALEVIFRHLASTSPALTLRGFVSATGSAGTLAAGDHLKDVFGTKIAAVEAAECPTMLYNGHGEHNIQGIGDKHIPLIHNVMNTDLAIAVSDSATDALGIVFNTDVGREYLTSRRGLGRELVDDLRRMGLSGICNVLAAIKMARYFGYGPNDVIVTVATDGYAMYGSELEKAKRKLFRGSFDSVNAGEAFGQHLLGACTEHTLELSHRDRERVFNLGYFTWVEQQGVGVREFDARKDLGFWRKIREDVTRWDAMIREFNAKTGVG